MYNLQCRVTFVSLGSTTQKGDWMILLELIDDTARAPMKMTVLGTTACVAVGDVDFSSIVQLRNVRCSIYKEETSFIVSDRDGFRIAIIPEEQEEHYDLPKAPPMRTCGLTSLGDKENSTCNLLVKITDLGEKEVTVEDPAGVTGTIALGAEAGDVQFEVGETYCLHHVSVKGDKLTLWATGGVELVTATAFEAAGADKA
eukprot:5365223-Amphidinium_carterae.2